MPPIDIDPEAAQAPLEPTPVVNGQLAVQSAPVAPPVPLEEAPALPPRLAVQDVSAWVLRAGVIPSVSVMLLGLVVSFLRAPPSVAQMEGKVGSPLSYDLGSLARGVMRGSGPSIVGVGVVLLVLTPIARVAMSMVMFALEERDRLYAVITFLVLAMTLISLLAIH